MRVSEVLSGSVESFLEMTPQMQDHLENAENPHKVTKNQVGLGNVTDEKQATDADFRSHKSAPVLDHPDESVSTEKLQHGAVTAEKIAFGAVTEAAIGEESVSETKLTESVRNKIYGKVDKVEGMGLSQNSFTDAEKAKLGALSVYDGDGVVVDTASLVLKSEPLKVLKTGIQFRKTTESPALPKNCLHELYSVVEDRQKGVRWFEGYRTIGGYNLCETDTDGNYKVTYQGTSRSVAYRVYKGDIYIGELGGNVAFIRKNGDTGSVWKSFMSPHATDTKLLEFYILDDRMVIVFACGMNGGELHVESYNMDCEREWVFITKSAVWMDYEGKDTYNRRFPKTAMVGDDIYIAPVLDTDHAHGVLKLNREGELVGQYMPITNFSESEDVLLSLMYHDGYLYGFAPAGYLVKINPETGEVASVVCEGSEGAALKSLTADRDGKILLYTVNAETGRNRFYKIDGKTMDTEKDLFPKFEIATDTDESYDVVCPTKNGFEFFVCTEDGVMASVYEVADIYTIL